MSETWRTRAYTAAEAADMAGIRRSVLDMWIHRQPADLFSGKRGYFRRFSPQDIAIIALARQLDCAGMSTLTAIACAYEHLEGGPPAPDAIFVVEPGRTSCTAGRFISDRDVERLQVDKSLILIPAGKIVAGIIAACTQ